MENEPLLIYVTSSVIITVPFGRVLSMHSLGAGCSVWLIVYFPLFSCHFFLFLFIPTAVVTIPRINSLRISVLQV